MQQFLPKKNFQLQNPLEHILLALNDLSTAHFIKKRLSFFGYSASIAQTTAQLQANANAFKTHILIIDVDFQQKQIGLKLSTSIINKQTSIIFLSKNNSIEQRILCSQHKGNAFFVIPFSMDHLFSCIHELSFKERPMPYRILIVEDAAPQAFFIASILKKSGMQCKAIQHSQQLLNTLDTFKPELIILDLYLPQVSGLDLAKVIRQQNNYIGVPIVFLSSEKNLEQKLQALKLGSDDFLTKPISAHHLLSTIHARVKRFRKMRQFMLNDSLTNLYNHSFFLSELKLAQQNSSVNNTPLSFAMLDLDYFKQVNDLYGHHVGDNVLKNLSYLLKKRLRHTDIIGRYGGEEFGIVLINTKTLNAYAVIENIRVTFSKMTQYGNKTEFKCTLSAGVCNINSQASTKQIIELADKGLYQAKNAGRNKCVVV